MYGYVYVTLNTISGRRYIGQKKGRFNQRYLGSGVALRAAVEKYGRSAFKVFLVARCETAEILNFAERLFIESEDAVRSQLYYNLAVGGDAWGSPSTPVTREKIRLKALGRVPANKGRKCPNVGLRMVADNPMRDPEVVARALKTRYQNWLAKGCPTHSGHFVRGQPAHNRIIETAVWTCEECGHFETRSTAVKAMESRFCNKSCAASWSNKKRRKKAA